MMPVWRLNLLMQHGVQELPAQHKSLLSVQLLDMDWLCWLQEHQEQCRFWRRLLVLWQRRDVVMGMQQPVTQHQAIHHPWMLQLCHTAGCWAMMLLRVTCHFCR
jgi:23S rRNA U2552 (ribose-2'-O)-methylase RlmE/FtsJ